MILCVWWVLARHIRIRWLVYWCLDYGSWCSCWLNPLEVIWSYFRMGFTVMYWSYMEVYGCRFWLINLSLSTFPCDTFQIYHTSHSYFSTLPQTFQLKLLSMSGSVEKYFNTQFVHMICGIMISNTTVLYSVEILVLILWLYYSLVVELVPRNRFPLVWILRSQFTVYSASTLQLSIPVTFLLRFGGNFLDINRYPI